MRRGTTDGFVRRSAWGGNEKCCAKNADSMNSSLVQIKAYFSANVLFRKKDAYLIMETKNKRSSYACMFHGLCIYFCSLNLLLFDVTRARRDRGRRWQRRQSAAAVSCWRLRRRLRLIKRGQRPCFIPCQIPRQDEREG